MSILVSMHFWGFPASYIHESFLQVPSALPGDISHYFAKQDNSILNYSMVMPMYNKFVKIFQLLNQPVESLEKCWVSCFDTCLNRAVNRIQLTPDDMHQLEVKTEPLQSRKSDTDIVWQWKPADDPSCFRIRESLQQAPRNRVPQRS